MNCQLKNGIKLSLLCGLLQIVSLKYTVCLCTFDVTYSLGQLPFRSFLGSINFFLVVTFCWCKLTSVPKDFTIFTVCNHTRYFRSQTPYKFQCDVGSGRIREKKKLLTPFDLCQYKARGEEWCIENNTRSAQLCRKKQIWNFCRLCWVF